MAQNFANSFARFDSNGYLLVTIGGGTIAAATITTLTTTKIIPPSDSTTALTLGNAAGTGLFVFDTTNGRIATGKATAPLQTVDFNENQNGSSNVKITNTTSDTSAAAGFIATAGSTTLQFFALSQGYTTSGRFVLSHGLIDTPYLDLSSSGANPIDFWSNGQKVMSMSTAGRLGRYGGVATAGNGVPSIYGIGAVAARTTVAASIATYTNGATDADFLVSGQVLVTTSTTHSFSLDCSYTDPGGTARTLILPVAQLAGTFITGGLITNVTGAGPYESASMHIRCKQTTAITIGTSAGTFTTVAYDASAAIQQLSVA